MNQVIIWSLIVGSGIFGIGLTSALASRKDRSRIQRRAVLEAEERQVRRSEIIRVNDSDAAMKQAASGRKEFAEISGNTR